MTPRNCCVGEITEGTRAGVDDHVVNVAVILQEPEKGLKHRALLDGLSGNARLDELLDDVRVDGFGLLFADVTLRGDGIAILIDITGSLRLLLT
ncbi:hypothetical protein FV140_17760 [Paenarthrobacter ureafaciens]|uniref:Uncharacterized protein n=1 Tax=Paenarthrobacter ureafaciens TaxID=37931 RepID=A0AAX3EG06_PAEUR|nr:MULTISPECIES: hypothetical protein [Paenarthrobacter]NKR11767.1 hypothetical protein [Arthrobacter sp. M5]NKR16888.1 hypothetical protein [Arthrobacter sp. M6]OEH60528.1 hypothetical protein A5N13_06130 [Arthrobacter sp. D4]OEH61143.1 hypothetical protein A5N17_17170 [Arthrobacter sp. D2]MDO5866086.1 hypothetical protein [Paenarthrobacter sp. SD-2]